MLLDKIGDFQTLNPSAASQEKKLARLFEYGADFVALGRPNESSPPPGALRLYADAASWQDTVGQMIASAVLIVMRVGASPSLRWELTQALRAAAPLLVWIPIEARKKRQLIWTEFGLLLESLLPGFVFPLEISDDVEFVELRKGAIVATHASNWPLDAFRGAYYSETLGKLLGEMGLRRPRIKWGKIFGTALGLALLAWAIITLRSAAP
jgi:hypothetical protein